MSDLVVRDAEGDDLEALTDIQNALLATTAVEWTDEPHTVDERRRWLERARGLGKLQLVGAVDGANDASIRFHQRLGFVEVGRMPQVGAKHGHWLDLVLLQLGLDDRPAPPDAAG